MALQHWMGSFKSKLAAMRARTHGSYGKVEKTRSMRVEIRSRRVHSCSSPKAAAFSSIERNSEGETLVNSTSASSPVAAAKEYPMDPSLPDIKNNTYVIDEFQMFSFKVRSCSHAYCHDCTKCPFVHPGENVCRSDPHKFHYSCAPSPDFRKGMCHQGDLCEYTHGDFECWLSQQCYILLIQSVKTCKGTHKLCW